MTLLVQPHKRSLDFHDFADKLKDIISGSLLHTAAPEPKVEIMRETLNSSETKSGLPHI